VKKPVKKKMAKKPEAKKAAKKMMPSMGTKQDGKKTPPGGW